MGVIETPAGNGATGGLVRVVGFQESLSLDERGRFRLPDDLAAALQRELGRVGGGAAFDRLALYFVPASGKRVFLYPVPNVRLALDRFEKPPAGMDPAVVRRARDYFYFRMRFVEADRQNRFSIPDGVRQHAGIDEAVQQITVVAHNNWLSLSRTDMEEQRAVEDLAAFDAAADELLDPVCPAPPASSGGANELGEEP